MIHTRVIDRAKMGAAIAVVLVALFLLAGCGKQAATPTVTPPTTAASAKTGFPAAVSAISTTAPDAKLLVVQSATAISTTGTPVWSYLFGSPKTGKTYQVIVLSGKAIRTTEYGTADLTPAQWAQVPPVDKWKINSPEAYEKARATANANPSSAYTMGFLMFLPPTAVGSKTKPLTWYVSFDPQTSNATTGTVGIDITTGAVVAK